MLHEGLELFHLSFTEKGLYIGRFAALRQSADDFGPGRLGQAGNLVERLVPCRNAGEKKANDDCLLADDALESVSI
jgi:hypothetical protein